MPLFTKFTTLSLLTTEQTITSLTSIAIQGYLYVYGEFEYIIDDFLCWRLTKLSCCSCLTLTSFWQILKSFSNSTLNLINDITYSYYRRYNRYYVTQTI